MNKRNRLVGTVTNVDEAKPGGRRMRGAARFRPQPSLASYVPLPLEDAVRVKSAELWLRLGEPLEALAEIENVPACRRRNSWVHRLHTAATRGAKSFTNQAVSPG